MKTADHNLGFNIQIEFADDQKECDDAFADAVRKILSADPVTQD